MQFIRFVYQVNFFPEPNAPRNLRQTSVTTDSISLAWDAPDTTSGSFEEYVIIINEVGAPTSAEVNIETLRCYIGVPNAVIKPS